MAKLAPSQQTPYRHLNSYYIKLYVCSNICSIVLHQAFNRNIRQQISKTLLSFLKQKYRARNEMLLGSLTCNVNNLSSNWTSFVRKSAPIVALYWLLNLRFTYLDAANSQSIQNYHVETKFRFEKEGKTYKI